MDAPRAVQTDPARAAVGTAARYQHVVGNERTPLIENNSTATKLLSIGRVPLLVFGCVGLLSLLVLFTVQNSSRPFTLPQFRPFAREDDGPLKTPTECLGPPYIYVSLHDKVSNVLKYSRNGCLIDDAVLLMDEALNTQDIQFRSLSVGKHKDHDALFIADASTHNSRYETAFPPLVYPQYSPCSSYSYSSFFFLSQIAHLRQVH
jgi:hypothetical protein